MAKAARYKQFPVRLSEAEQELLDELVETSSVYESKTSLIRGLIREYAMKQGILQNG